MAVRLIVRLRYPNAGAFRFDCQTQIAVGGLLVDHDHAGELPVVEGEVSLEIWIEGTVLMRTTAEVVELTETSLQLGLPEATCAMIDRACQARFADVAADGSQAGIASLYPPAEPKAAPATLGEHERETRESLDRRIKGMTSSERVQLALHGGREERTLLLRERMPNVQAALVRNPKLTADELLSLARSPHLGAETAEAIAKHPAWGGSPQVAMALVRNPKTPTPIGLKLIAVLQPGDLRIIAKGGAGREQLAAAARKRLLIT